MKGPLSANSADAVEATLLAGLGIAMQPDFVVWEALESGTLERVLARLVRAAAEREYPDAGRRTARVAGDGADRFSCPAFLGGRGAVGEASPKITARDHKACS